MCKEAIKGRYKKDVRMSFFQKQCKGYWVGNRNLPQVGVAGKGNTKWTESVWSKWKSGTVLPNSGWEHLMLPHRAPCDRCVTAPLSEEEGEAKKTHGITESPYGSEEPRAVVGFFFFLLFLVLFLDGKWCWSPFGEQKEVKGHLGYRKSQWPNWALKCLFSIVTFTCPCSHDCNATWLTTSWSKCELIYLPMKHKNSFPVFMFFLKAKSCASLAHVNIKTIPGGSQTHFPIPCCWRVAPQKWLTLI